MSLASIIEQRLVERRRKRLAYRSRIEILYCILRLARRPVHITKIMTNCNLSWSRTRSSLNLLQTKGLIRRVETESGEIYKSTTRGKDFVRYMRHVMKLLGEK